eukprot:1065258-Heterocapsa_arctica.AAC.1
MVPPLSRTALARLLRIAIKRAVSRRNPSRRSRCFSPPFFRLSFCQLLPAVQGMLAMTWAPG